MKDFLRKAFGVYAMLFAILVPILFYGLIFNMHGLVNIVGGFIVASALLLVVVALFCMGIDCLKD